MRILFISFLAIILLMSCTSLPVNSDFVSPTVALVKTQSDLQGYLSGKILYVTSGEMVNVFISTPDDGDREMVLSDTSIRAASLSPDAKLVAYVIDDAMYVKNITDGRIRRLNSQRISGFFNGMEWSPDSKWIGFDCFIDNVSEICIIDAENGSLKTLTDTKKFGAQFLNGATFGSWNDDGSQILYCVKVSGPQGGVPITRFMLLDVLNVSSIQLMDEKNEFGIANYGCPILQPYTQSIFFAAKRDAKYMIFSANIDGSNIRQITSPLIKYDILEPITVSPSGEYFFANSAKQDSEELIGVPTLFSSTGQIIFQLDLPGAEVVSWVEK